MIQTSNELLARFARIKVSKSATDSAPHKPLLLLSVMDLVESGLITTNPIPRSAELTYQFLTYSRVVAHRRTGLDIRMPFHHLGGDGIWQPLDKSLRPSPDNRVTMFAQCPDAVVIAFQDPSFRDQARRLLIVKYFLPSEQLSLAASLGIPEGDLGLAVATVEQVERERAVKRGRDVRFRQVVVAAYNFTCGLTRHRLTTLNRGSLVDAAHIHQFSDSRNNDPRNGIALSKNAHWMFDQGLWTITDDLTVQVAHTYFVENHPSGEELSSFEGRTLLVPADPLLRPDATYLAWHRKKRFLASEQRE